MKEGATMRKTRWTAALLALSLLLCGFEFSPRPGRLYFSWHAAMTCRGSGASLAFLLSPLKMYVNNMGSDGGSHADNSVTFHAWMPRDGFYDLRVDFVSGSQDRYFEVVVNGEVCEVPCPGGSWDKLASAYAQIPLRKGRNILRFGNAAWYAPGLHKIVITESDIAQPPPTDAKERDMEEFSQNGVVLALDTANGTFGVTQDGRVLFRDAFAAADFEGRRLYTQQYETHEVRRNPSEIIFSHTSEGLPDLKQRFVFKGGGDGEGGKNGYLLADVAMESPDGVRTNWISPLCADGESLKGGARFLQVPFDNDNYDSFKRASVNSVGSSHEMTALLGENGDAVVIGSVTHDTWKTGVEWRGIRGAVRHFCVYGGMTDAQTRDTLPHGAVSGPSVVSPTILIGAFDDWREGLDAYGAANAEIAPPLPWSGGAPMGWNSWGVVQDKLTREIAYAASDYFEEHFTQWREEPLTINLDAWWNEALGMDHEGLKVYVDYCAANGQKAGAYHTPFVAWATEEQMRGSPLYPALLRDENGNVLPAWDGALALDVTHPLVIEQIRQDIQRFLDAGFSYLKMDFLSHGAMEGAHRDPNVQTGLQAYNQAMARIAEQIGGRMFINLSIAPIFPHQYAHGRRVSCDTFYQIGGTKYMLNSLTFGFWQREIYACPDPDHIVVWGGEGQAGENEARARVTSGAMLASFLGGDDFSRFAADPQAQARFDLLLKNPDIMALARSRKVFTPAELPKGSAANVYALRDGGTTCVAVFNFEARAQNFALDLEALAGPGPWRVKELWSGEIARTGEAAFAANIAGQDARVYEVKRDGG